MSHKASPLSLGTDQNVMHMMRSNQLRQHSFRQDVLINERDDNFGVN